MATRAPFAVGIYAFYLPWYAILALSLLDPVDTSTGEVKHIMQQVIIGGGMLTARGKRDKPLLRLENFLESLKWPASVDRVPQKVCI